MRVVIELKDARADLDKPQNRATDRRTPVEQAFGYASKVGGRCRWVIVRNFVELRLYPATDQSQSERFDLGTLPGSRTELNRFFRLLLREQLLAEHGESPIDHLYRERQGQEREISENFYGEYKQARLDLLAHLRQENPAVPELLLFNKAPKLPDRVVFVCFCEDKTIIPPLPFRGLLRAVHEDRFNRSESRIYERVKGLFRAIDEGYPDAGINKCHGGPLAQAARLGRADLGQLRRRAEEGESGAHAGPGGRVAAPVAAAAAGPAGTGPAACRPGPRPRPARIRPLSPHGRGNSPGRRDVEPLRQPRPRAIPAWRVDTSRQQ